MTRQWQVGSWHGWPRMRTLLCLWLAALAAVACADPSGERFLTPLPADIDLRLVTNRWEAVEVVYQGEQVRFDGVPHLRVGFDWRGTLSYASGCYVWSFQIDFESQSRYRLTRRENLPGVTCVDPLDMDQYQALVRALEATQEYQFQDNQLWLTGEDTRFVLEVAESYPVFPAAERSLILNRWRWMEAWDQAGSVGINELSPIYITFLRDSLSLVSDGCMIGFYRSGTRESGGYVLTRGELSPCEGTTDQTEWALAALLRTTHYELQEDRLILTGDNVRIVLQIGGRLSGYSRTYPRPTSTLPVSPLIPAQPSEPEDPMVASYAKDMGISYDEAARRMAIQDEMGKLHKRLLDDEPDFVTSWLVHRPELGMVAGFIGPNGEEIIQKYLEGIEWADLVKTQQVKYTLDELLALQRQVIEIARTAEIPFNSGANIPIGKVTLYTPFPDELREELEAMEAMQPYLADIEYVYVDALAAPAGAESPGN